MKILLLVCSLASFLLLATAAYEENFSGTWRAYQRTFRDLLTETATTDAARQAAASFEIKYQQIYLLELDAIDRCTTCHLGIENPAMEEVEQPWRRHPGQILAQHPSDKFGCTICHQGQGRAVTQQAAHGWHEDGTLVKHVEAPLLRKQAVYTSCGRCHFELDPYDGVHDLYEHGTAQEAGAPSRSPIGEATLALTLPGADVLTQGKRLFVESGCLGCHPYRGRGGVLGPDLTYVGDKTVHDFDFTHVKGEHTVEHWLYEHFMFPKEVSPGTTMPEMGLSSEQVRSLTLYVMGLHRKTAPASYLPRPVDGRASGEPVVRGSTLYAIFCSACHGADGYGTTMRTGLWPIDADPWGRDWDDRSVRVEQRGEIDILVPSLHHQDTLGTVSDDYLQYIIRHGRPGTTMLAWAGEGGLIADEITLLVDYIRSWQQPAPNLADISAERGDPAIGGALYHANCAACHGVNGEGGIGNSLNSSTFLAVASDGFLSSTITEGRPNTAMPAWREFDTQEISDLLAFIRQWQPERADRDEVLALVATTQPAGGPPDASADIGRILYKANCVMCHGADGSGDLAPSLNTQAFLTVVPDAYLVETLIEGRPGTGMPSWHHLPSRDIASIVRFIRSWQSEPSKSAEWHEQVVPHGDWDAGRYLFAGNCAGCHGNDGEGATGPQLNNPVFLRSATDVTLREWITHGKEYTEMRGFRKGGQGVTELTERQIEDIVAHLRRFERMDGTERVRVSKSPYGRPELGAQLWENNCAGCHGDRGQGSSGPALSNPNFLRFASDGFLMATMALGRDGTEMRPVKRGPQSILGLTSDEVNNLVAYLRSWEVEPPFQAGGEAVIPHRFVIPWNLARGRDLFASLCAGCHGDEGKGMWAPELNNEGFLAAATDGVLQATIVRGRRGTAMRSFGTGTQGLADLTEQDVDDIVAYMRQWSKRTPSPITLPAERSLIIPIPQTEEESNPLRDPTRGQDPATNTPPNDANGPVATAMPSVQGDQTDER